MAPDETKSGIKKPQKGERRSRRTHKNSRDGCPNCRANRIKCTEELPSCLNCVKKKYRCGYIDFPPERLNHIRHKNEQKAKLAAQAAPFDLKHDRRLSIRIRDPRPVDQSNLKMIAIRNLVYSNAFNDVNQISTLGLALPPGFKPWEEGHLFDFSTSHAEVLVDPLQTLPPNVGMPLPHALAQPTSFARQQVPARLRNSDLATTARKIQHGSLNLKAMRNDLALVEQPVWVEEDATLFWLLVINQAVVLNLYFQYFIDKALNILVRASDAVVNGDIDYSSLPSTAQDSLPAHLPRDNLFSFFYNREDLELLTKKLYVTYGRVIRNLRELLSDYNPEYPAKMSLVLAWTCYFNVATDMSTFCLMVSGTAIMLHKILHEAESAESLSPALRQITIMMNLFVLALAFPDYSFDVILDIVDNFVIYKNHVDRLINSYDKGHNYSHDLQKVLRDPLFRHDFHELDKFLVKLRDYYFPLISSANRYYKLRNGYGDDPNLHFVSPTLVFEMTYEWFKVYPGDKLLMGLRINPLKKTLYFFFHALGKCMAHVFTPMKSLLFVDACNITFTKVGMEFPRFNGLDLDEYAPLAPVLMGLFKTIRFFEHRLMLFGYYMVVYSVLDREFILPVAERPQSDWEYRDIVHLAPAKIQVEEKQLSSLTRNLVLVKNIPFFDEIKTNPACAKLIQREMDRQYFAVQHEPYQFDYASGMSNHDFNPAEVIKCFVAQRTEKLLARSPTTIEVLRLRADRLMASRNEVTKAVQAANE